MSVQVGIGGDLDSVRQLTTWLRRLAYRVEECASTAREVRDLHLDRWSDDAREALEHRLEVRAREADAYADAIRRLATTIEICAWGLRAAQEVLDEVGTHVSRGALTRENGWVLPPGPNEDPWQGLPQPRDREESERRYRRRLEEYRAVQDLADRASAIVIEQFEILGHALEEDWAKAWFVNVTLMQGAATSRLATNPTGLAFRVFNRTGALVPVAEAIYAISRGDDPVKAIFTMGVSVSASVLAIALVPPTMGMSSKIFLATASGVVAGHLSSEAAEVIFEESPRDKLERYYPELTRGPDALKEWPR